MNKQLIEKAIKCLAIHDVYLREYEAKLKPDFDPNLANVDELRVQYKYGPGQSNVLGLKNNNTGDEINILRVDYLTALRMFSSDPKSGDESELEKLTVAFVGATFICDYVITEKLEEDAIREFCMYNVGHNVWPYWREFAQTSTERLRLPRVVLPFYQTPKYEEKSP